METSPQQAPPSWAIVGRVNARFEDSDAGRVLRGPSGSKARRIEDGSMEVHFRVTAADESAAIELADRIIQTALSWAGMQTASAGVNVQLAEPQLGA